MRKLTQLLSATLALCFLLSLIPVPASAEAPAHPSETQLPISYSEENTSLPSEDTEELSTQASGGVAYSGYCGAEGDGTNVLWEFDPSALTLTFTGSGPMADYSSYGKVPWKAAVDDAKPSHSSDWLVDVVVGEGITHVSSYLCDCLTNNCDSVTLPSTLTSIGHHAFYGMQTGLSAKLEIPASVEEIGDYAFAFITNVSELVITNPDTVYGEYAFYNNRLSKVTLPEGMKTIPTGFLGKTDITELHLPESITDIGEKAFESCTKLTSANFPSSLVTIGDRAFASTNLSGYLAFPDTLEHIGDDAFNVVTGITGFSWPANLKSVGSSAFSQCRALSGHLVLPENVTFGDYAFGSCESITGVTLPSDESLFENDVFNSCKGITSVTIPDTWTTIPKNIFWSCSNLLTCSLPDGLEVIGAGAFAYCSSLKDLTLPETVRELGSGAFQGCASLRDIHLPDALKTLGTSVFADCTSLRSINLVDKFERIPGGTFENCTSLPSLLVLPETVKTLDYKAYLGSSVKSVRFLGDAPQVSIAGNSSSTFNEDCVLYYTPGKEGWTSPTWRGYSTYTILGEGSYEFHDADYYSSLSLRNFDFLADIGPRVEQPVSSVTLTYQGASLSTGEGETSISTGIMVQEGTQVSFTQPEMFDVSLPVEVLSTFNTIEFYPKTGAYPTTKPFVQAVYARHDAEDDYTDLLHGSLNFYAGSVNEQTELYVQVNWNGQSGKLYLSQTLDPADGWEIQDGFTEQGNISLRLKSGKGLYLLMEYSGKVEAVQLGAVLLTEDTDLDLVLGESFDASAPSSGGQFLSEFEFKVDFPKDISLSLTVKRDGTVQALLGFKPVKESDEDAAYLAFDTIKDAFEYQDKKENGLDTKKLRDLMEAHGQKVAIQKSSFVVDCSLSVLGYAEGKLVKYDNGQYGIVLSKGTLGVSIEGGVTQTFQLYAASVPFYISGSIKPKVTFNVTVYSNEANDAFEIDPIDVKAALAMKVAGGLGWDSIASAGIYGKGTGEVAFKIPMTKNDSSCTFQGSIGAEASFFCFSFDLVIFEGEKIYLWGEKADTASLSLMALQEADWQPQPRDYLGVEADLGLNLMSVGEENTVLTAGTIFNWSMYPYATVQTAALSGGRQVAVWTDDQGLRSEDNNRTVLYYSYYNGSRWSCPNTVEVGDDETADFNPKLKTINDTVYLVWQDATRPLTAEDTNKTIPALLDLTCYRFDPTSQAFSRMGKFGTEYYDSTMDMTMVDGKFAVVWVSNSVNSAFGGKEKTYSIQRLMYGQQNPVTLVSDLYLVDGLAADGEDIWFSADTDGDPNTLADREIFHFDGSTLEQVTHNDVADLKPVITGGQLVWYSDGAIQNGQDTVALATDTDRYQYLRSDTGMEAIVYLEDDELRKSTLYASFNDGSGWGEPIALTGTTGNIGSFSAVFLSNGTLSITACERGLDAGQKNYLNGTALLTTYSVSPYCDLAVENATYLEQSLVKGGTLDIQVQVANRGMANVDILNIQVKNNGRILNSAAFDASLSSGQSDCFYISLPLGADLTAYQDLTVTVSASGYPYDKTPEDNTASFSLRLSDVSVEGAVASSDGTSTQVKALVVNRGQTDLGNLTVNLYDSDGSTLLDTQTVTAPAAGEGTFVTFQLAQGMENNRFLTVEATAEGLEPLEENPASNNTSIAVVKGPRTEACILSASAVAGSGGKVSVIASVQNSTQEEKQYSLYFAVYRADGKLLDSRVLADQVTAAGAQNLGQVDFYSTEADYVRVFVLDDTYAPLTEAAECPV